MKLSGVVFCVTNCFYAFIFCVLTSEGKRECFCDFLSAASFLVKEGEILGSYQESNPETVFLNCFIQKNERQTFCKSILAI
jgi:hypothetical protein